jgi:GTPase SAR1 family protein
MKQIQSNTPQKEQIAIVLIGNKCDVDNREVTKEEGELLSKEYGLKYFETSALNNLNIEETFNHLSAEIIRLKDFKEIGISSPQEQGTIDISKNKDKKDVNQKKCC